MQNRQQIRWSKEFVTLRESSEAFLTLALVGTDWKIVDHEEITAMDTTHPVIPPNPGRCYFLIKRTIPFWGIIGAVETKLVTVITTRGHEGWGRYIDGL